MALASRITLQKQKKEMCIPAAPLKLGLAETVILSIICQLPCTKYIFLSSWEDWQLNINK